MSELAELRRELESRKTEQLVSILRNRDEEEWRPEVFDVVAEILRSRGVSPDEVAALGPEPTESVEHRPLETVARCFHVAEAHALRMALEDAGIAAWIVDETLGTSYGIGVGARLQVRAEDRAEAEAVLARAPVSAEALPPELAEPPCPRCGSANTSPRADLASEAAPGSRSGRVWRTVCGQCGYTWSDAG